ncbi:type III restriction enzyme [Spirochaetota bacterium]|nr:type III restriction enzyme [Spirochaetota bacterium]
MSELHEKISSAVEYGKTPLPEIPPYIPANLKHSFYEWQEQALKYFLIDEEKRDKEKQLYNSPTHLMFNMATGTGKTLLMAALILYYYKEKGYRHFLFFGNLNNIVAKTENNFIDTTHTKYLYKDKITIDNKIISIKNVETFSRYPNPLVIEIKFTTIQQLHKDLHSERENKVVLSELVKKDLVILGDEAHHLNKESKDNSGTQLTLGFDASSPANSNSEEKPSWERTVVNKLLNKNGLEKDRPNKNVLLEFTATIPKGDQVKEKYKDKIVYEHTLKDFLKSGHAKNINLISSTLDKKERMLQALLFHWYRHRLALKYDIANFKPVILFRSKTIDESAKDYKFFLDLVKDIKSSDLKFLDNIERRLNATDSMIPYQTGKTKTEALLNFIKTENIKNSELVEFIKENFNERTVIITNSKNNKNKTEKTSLEQDNKLNNLEDKDNHIRAIFTVKRLTEGWDVLNLFDIVRLYQGQNAGGRNKDKTPDATLQEKQLIGRGIRYFPFAYRDRKLNTKYPKNKRKFDKDLNHELRMLEELFYYTYDEESRYITHLKKELRRDGYISDKKVVILKIKDDFRNSDLYKDKRLLINELKPNPNRKRTSLNEIQREPFGPYITSALEVTEEQFKTERTEETYSSRQEISKKEIRRIKVPFEEIEYPIFRKAIHIKAKDENSLFRFDRLSKELDIKSIDDLRTKDDILKNPKIFIRTTVTAWENLENKEKLKIVCQFLEDVAKKLSAEIIENKGSNFEPVAFKDIFDKPKSVTVDKDFDNEENKTRANKIVKCGWYALDNLIKETDEESALVDFIKDHIDCKDEYEIKWLLRNEEVYKIYDFDKGRGFCPDYLLFLKHKNHDDDYYQILIEAKGNQYKGSGTDLFSSPDKKWGQGAWNLSPFYGGKEDWKEKFLEDIMKKYGHKNIITDQSKNYRLIGLPFYNKKASRRFKDEFENLKKLPSHI